MIFCSISQRGQDDPVNMRFWSLSGYWMNFFPEWKMRRFENFSAERRNADKARVVFFSHGQKQFSGEPKTWTISTNPEPFKWCLVHRDDGLHLCIARRKENSRLVECPSYKQIKTLKLKMIRFWPRDTCLVKDSTWRVQLRFKEPRVSALWV